MPYVFYGSKVLAIPFCAGVCVCGGGGGGEEGGGKYECPIV